MWRARSHRSHCHWQVPTSTGLRRFGAGGGGFARALAVLLGSARWGRRGSIGAARLRVWLAGPHRVGLVGAEVGSRFSRLRWCRAMHTEPPNLLLWFKYFVAAFSALSLSPKKYCDPRPLKVIKAPMAIFARLVRKFLHSPHERQFQFTIISSGSWVIIQDVNQDLLLRLCPIRQRGGHLLLPWAVLKRMSAGVTISFCLFTYSFGGSGRVIIRCSLLCQRMQHMSHHYRVSFHFHGTRGMLPIFSSVVIFGSLRFLCCGIVVRESIRRLRKA